MEGNFIWKAVGVVIRIDHRELDLIHKWIKNKAHPSDYSSERDAKSFTTNFDGLAFHRSLGWIQLSRDRGIHRPLVKIELPETVCDLCYITFDKLPNGITYLSLYFLLSEEATKRIRFANVQEIERYVCFQSFNPFSKKPRILETHNRLQGIENLIKNNLNLTFRDAQLATSYILNMWGIKKKVEEFNTIADFYREYETPYFDKSNRGLLTKRTVCNLTLLRGLNLLAYSRNIDFEISNDFIYNFLNIKNNTSVVKFIFANEADMLPCNRRIACY